MLNKLKRMYHVGGIVVMVCGFIGILISYYIGLFLKIPYEGSIVLSELGLLGFGFLYLMFTEFIMKHEGN